MKLSDLILEIKNKDSFLCIGLDTDINKIPKFLLKEEDPIFLFNKSIIDNTNPYCVAYKINTCLLYTSPSPQDLSTSSMPSSA